MMGEQNKLITVLMYGVFIVSWGLATMTSQSYDFSCNGLPTSYKTQRDVKCITSNVMLTIPMSNASLSTRASFFVIGAWASKDPKNSS